MTYYRTVLLFLLLQLFLTATAQIPNQTRQGTVDSLFALLPDAKGTDQVDVLNQLALELSPRTFDSSFRYAEEAFRLSEELDYPWGKGIATFNFGNCYYFKTDIKNALTNYLAAWWLLEPFEPKKEIGDLLLMLGSINEYVRNTDKVFELYNRAARNYFSIGDSSAAMLVYVILGSSYYYKLQTLSQIDTLTSDEINTMMDSAIKYNDLVLDYYSIPHDKYMWMSLEAWLVNLYNYSGCYYAARGDSLGLEYYIKAYEISKEIEHEYDRNFFEGLMLANLGLHYYFAMIDTVKGYEYVYKAPELLRKTERYDMYACALSMLGQVEKSRGCYQESEAYLIRALNYSDTFLMKVDRIPEPDPTFRLWGVAQMRSMRGIMIQNLVSLYESTGDLKNALQFQKRLEEEKGLQIRDELTRQIIGLQATQEDEIKRQQINGLIRDNELRNLRLKQTRIVFATILSMLLIILLIAVLWFQHRRFRSDRNTLILEQKLLRSQMNPHFIFNSLSSIQNFIVTEKPDKASIYLSKFARLVRNILDNSTQEFVPLEKEISTIENYLELQKVRYAGKFEYRIEIADTIDPETMQIPPMLAQPFIENAIEHGIKHRETPGHIDIRFTMKDHTLLFEVEDDGVGRQKAREIEVARDPGHRSMATSLTHERLVNLNRKLNKKIVLEIIDLKNTLGEACGTRVMFGIPVNG